MDKPRQNVELWWEHSGDNLTQEPLATGNYCNTLIVAEKLTAANILEMERQVVVIGALAEGAGIRQIERITGVQRDTIMRLGVRGPSEWQDA